MKKTMEFHFSNCNNLHGFFISGFECCYTCFMLQK